MKFSLFLGTVSIIYQYFTTRGTHWEHPVGTSDELEEIRIIF